VSTWHTKKKKKAPRGNAFWPANEPPGIFSRIRPAGEREKYPQARLMEAFVKFGKPIASPCKARRSVAEHDADATAEVVYEGESAKFQLPFIKLGTSAAEFDRAIAAGRIGAYTAAELFSWQKRALGAARAAELGL